VLLPIPSSPNDRIKVCKLRIPSQSIAGTRIARNEHCRITGSPRCVGDRYGMSHDPLGSLDNLPHRESLAISKIVHSLGLVFERLKGKDVSVRKIIDVNVVTDARAIRSRIVSSKDAY